MTDSNESEQSRSERLRQRRSKHSELPREVTTPDAARGTESSTDADGETSAKTEGESTTTEGRIKDEQVGTYMYIPASQKKDLQRQYNLLKAEYEFEFETSFEKNRHFYPLLVQYGLDGLDGLDAMEIRDRLNSL